MLRAVSPIRLLAALVLLVYLSPYLSRSASILDAGPDPVPGFRGSASFSSESTTGPLTIRVEYGVYSISGPLPTEYGPFTPFFNFQPYPTDPGQERYVYAYRLVNEGSLALEQFGLGLYTGAEVTTVGYSGTTGVLPDYVTQTTTGLEFLFFFTHVAPGEFSRTLMVVSPDGPAMATAYVLGGGGSAPGLLPSPAVPAPTAAAAGGLLLLLKMVARHRHR